jgi:hypothetical protein
MNTRPITIKAAKGGEGCDFQAETWGPHPGCKEFMSAPEVWPPCGERATTRFEFRDDWQEAMTGEDAHTVLLRCAEHAEVARQELAEAGNEISGLVEADLTVAEGYP